MSTTPGEERHKVIKPGPRTVFTILRNICFSLHE